MQDDDLLAEQRASYRARAPEYDDWWLRRGRYDRGEADAREWGKQVATVAAALDGFGSKGDVLELAGGTSWWTERLARTATRLTVVDSSPEMLERNRARVGRADVEYVNADLFEWRPPRTYDLVFFSFWISHVPRARLASFWALVRACLVPGGRLLLVDNRNDPAPAPDAVPDPFVVRYEPDLHRRRLGDGSEYRVV
jgi:demethylmenaquinone methyltransferase/2-methoxy-6-polyprenyl-1,4-benzoquinol methylase